MSFELRKYLIQFFLLVALGAVIAYVVDDTNRRTADAETKRREDRDRADRERQSAIDVVTALLSRLGEIYGDVKRERHLLRLVPLEDLSKQGYVASMRWLHDEKQALEDLWKDMEAYGEWLPELIPLGQLVKEMETYLRPLENELEAVKRLPDATFQATSRTELMGFLAKKYVPTSTFHVFRSLEHRARAGLVELLSTERTGIHSVE